MKYYLENNNEAKDLLVRMDALATINNYTKTENMTGYEHVMEQAADGQINFPMVCIVHSIYKYNTYPVSKIDTRFTKSEDCISLVYIYVSHC